MLLEVVSAGQQAQHFHSALTADVYLRHSTLRGKAPRKPQDAARCLSVDHAKASSDVAGTMVQGNVA